MASVLTHAIIANATAAVDSYVVEANGLFEELQGIVSNLTTNNFNGDASDGYNVFFTQKVVPALTDNLTAPEGSITAGVKSILENIQLQLLDTVDPQLGENNQSAGGAAEGTTI